MAVRKYFETRSATGSMRRMWPLTPSAKSCSAGRTRRDDDSSSDRVVEVSLKGASRRLRTRDEPQPGGVMSHGWRSIVKEPDHLATRFSRAAATVCGHGVCEVEGRPVRGVVVAMI